MHKVAAATASGRQNAQLAAPVTLVDLSHGQPLTPPPAPPRCSYGFVRYSSVSDAQMAIAALDGTTVLGHKLQVKFADADAGPPAAAAPSGLTPSDSCYAKHLPANWGVS